MTENTRTSTSTQIRNFYSDGISYMNVKFFNTNLSFQLYPFISKDALGRSSYDMKNGQLTTVNFEGAYALWDIAKKIIDGTIPGECELPIPCAAGASLSLSRRFSDNGHLETVFSITKNNVTIPFVFQTMKLLVKENGQAIPKVIETGLGAFQKTIEGYLNGINADRHLDKLTDDYIKSQQGNQSPQPNYGNNNNYRNNNGGYNKKPYQNNGGYKKPYQNQNNNGYNQNNPGWGGRQQDMSSYQIKN